MQCGCSFYATSLLEKAGTVVTLTIRNFFKVLKKQSRVTFCLKCIVPAIVLLVVLSCADINGSDTMIVKTTLCLIFSLFIYNNTYFFTSEITSVTTVSQRVNEYRLFVAIMLLGYQLFESIVFQS